MEIQLEFLSARILRISFPFIKKKLEMLFGVRYV